MAASEWWETAEHPPMETPDVPAPQLFTADQVATAIAAAVEAQAAGEDPREAARTAIAEVDPA
ncbi:hypothetical protein [Mycobacterium sp.]|uniref:hypothetical protein n=1 Tax=Mycobacterium sp. TaxID=1785 RepID=UPI0025CCFFAC|nr:hypothetical protein [Mycobacterium sp.]